MIFSVLVANAQIKKRVSSVSSDTLNGAETVYFPFTSTGDTKFTVQAICTEIGGTADGTLTLEGSIDNSNWQPLTDVEKTVLTAYPNDSLTITDAAFVLWHVRDNAWKYYRIKGVGTASDSTLITPSTMPY